MLPNNDPAPPEPSPHERFLQLLEQNLEAGTFVKVVLGQYRGAEPELRRVAVRQLTVRGQLCLSFVYRYKTRDITANKSMADGLAAIRDLLADSFRHAHLQTVTADIQLSHNRKGQAVLRSGKIAAPAVPVAGHDREKPRCLDLGAPFLVELGITDDQHQLIPAMSRKWKQINKFIEVLDDAMAAAGLKQTNPLSVTDFGSGKGYLTFALHDYLQNRLGLTAQVTGVERRDDLVRLCHNAATKLQLAGLAFVQGDISSYAPPAMQIMIALHACDTATDEAIGKGIRAGAAIIMCSPCCHKQIRPQLQIPRLLHPILRHGIHLGQEAEMITDSLRALLLESEGYATQVFEFIALEHTSKNKMILAVKHANPVKRQDVLAQIRELKNFYGIREHCLETLLTSRSNA